MKYFFKLSLIWIILLMFCQRIDAQSKQQNQLKRDSIGIGYFELLGKAVSGSYSELVSQQIVFGLAIALEEYGYQIEVLKGIIGEAKSKDPTKQKVDEVYINNFLIGKSIKYYISGTVKEISDKSFELHIILKDITNQGKKKADNDYELYINSLRNLNYNLDLIGDAIHNDIQRSKSIDNKRQLAVICYDTQPVNELKDTFQIPNDLALYNYIDMDSYGISGLELIGWESSKAECRSIDSDLDRISRRLKADIIISGDFEYLDNKGSYTVYPEIYLFSEKVTIKLPGFSNYDNDFQTIQERVSYNQISLMEDLVNVDGTYNDKLFKILSIDEKPAIALIKEYYSDKNYVVAALLANKVLQYEPVNRSARLLLSMSRTENDELDEAIEVCAKIEKDNPNWDSLFYQKGVIYQYREEFKKAINEFKIVLRLNPSFPYINHKLGLSYYIFGDLVKSINSLNDQLAINEKDRNTLTVLSSIYLFSAQDSSDDIDESSTFYNSALEYCENAILIPFQQDDYYTDEDLDGLKYMIMQEQGLQFYRAKQYPETIKCYLVMKDVYADEFSLDMLRYSYSKLDNYEKVNEIIEEGISKGIYTDSVYYKQALHLRGEKDEFDKFIEKKLLIALDYIEKYLELQPNQPEALRIKGSTYFRLKMLVFAVEMYNVALIYETRRLEKSSILLDLVEINIMQGDYQTAIENLDKLDKESLNTNNWDTKSNYYLKQYLRVTALYLSDQDYKYMEKSLRSEVKKNKLMGWSYVSFMEWINDPSNEISNSQKDFVRDLTEFMEEHTVDF